ncbi:MAG: HipA N-terminal domain-containing protein [Bacteriovorax sp.]|nr:HipA N-terminal domain-containing protein [Bacteriovorax sp.]
METLFVFYDHRLVGRLIKNADATLNFSYEKNWIQETGSFPLSPRLDLEVDKVFDNRVTRSFFDNLLPEGKVREHLEKYTGKSLTDDFQFLRQFGVDCAGAFLISPDEHLAKNKVDQEVDEINIEELVKAYNEHKNLMSYVVENHNGRFSLAGAQGEIKRHHQVDFCQAQGFLSGEKYEEDGGPGLKENFNCIRMLSSSYTHDAQKYMNWISFNLLIGNNDCH